MGLCRSPHGGGGLFVSRARYSYGWLPTVGWLLFHHKMTSKQSNNLNIKLVETSFHLALSITPQDEPKKDVPWKASALVWG